MDTHEPEVLATWNSGIQLYGLEHSYLPLLGLCITLASAYRLATFNLDEDQQSYFKGLPTPANTLLIISFPLIMEFQHSSFVAFLIINPWFLVGLTVLSCYLLNSKVKLFALKFKVWSFQPNAIRYSFLVLSLVLLILFHFVAVPMIILLYVGLSLVDTYVLKHE